MNIILFGPPGVGKSTLIGLLKTAGFRAIDLEDVYPSSIRFSLPNMVDGVVFGAADLNPRRTYHNAMKVLLNLDEEKYASRRASRDRKRPAKAHQRQQTMAEWTKGVKYDVVLNASGTARQTASAVRKILNKEVINHVASKKGKT